MSDRDTNYHAEEPFVVVYHQKRNDEPCFRNEIYPRSALTWLPYSRAIRLSRGTTKLNLKNYTPVHVANRSFVILHATSSSSSTTTATLPLYRFYVPSRFLSLPFPLSFFLFLPVASSLDELATPADCQRFRRCRMRIFLFFFFFFSKPASVII